MNTEDSGRGIKDKRKTKEKQKKNIFPLEVIQSFHLMSFFALGKHSFTTKGPFEAEGRFRRF
jgi:hypothetical protein